MFARLEDPMERGILERPQGRGIFDPLIAIRLRIGATTRDLPVLGWIESFRWIFRRFCFRRI